MIIYYNNVWSSSSNKMSLQFNIHVSVVKMLPKSPSQKAKFIKNRKSIIYEKSKWSKNNAFRRLTRLVFDFS